MYSQLIGGDPRK